MIVTPLFNRSGGSILLPAFFHFMLNNPIWPDAQPYDTYLLVPAAVLVVWYNRKTLFTREGAVTDVVPGSGSLEMWTVAGSGSKPSNPLEAF